MIRLRGKAKSRQRRPDPSKGTGHVSRSLEAISTMGGFLRGPAVACQQPVAADGQLAIVEMGAALAFFDLLAQCNRRSSA